MLICPVGLNFRWLDWLRKRAEDLSLRGRLLPGKLGMAGWPGVDQIEEVWAQKHAFKSQKI